MNCHKCGACCTEISISSEIPGMKKGKPAGVRCLHLGQDNLCQLFGKPERPKICSSFQAEEWLCGKNKEEAIINIRFLENYTSGIPKNL